MDFLSFSNNKIYNKKNKNGMKQVLSHTNYNYRAFNQNTVDNSYASISGKYTISPDIKTTYPKPYMTGKCVSSKERTQVPFNMHKQPRLFSELVNN